MGRICEHAPHGESRDLNWKFSKAHNCKMTWILKIFTVWKDQVSFIIKTWRQTQLVGSLRNLKRSNACDAGHEFWLWKKVDCIHMSTLAYNVKVMLSQCKSIWKMVKILSVAQPLEILKIFVVADQAKAQMCLLVSTWQWVILSSYRKDNWRKMVQKDKTVELTIPAQFK